MRITYSMEVYGKSAYDLSEKFTEDFLVSIVSFQSS